MQSNVLSTDSTLQLSILYQMFHHIACRAGSMCRIIETPTWRMCARDAALSIPLLALIMLAAMRTTSGLTPNCDTALASRNMSASLCTPSSDSVSESCSSSLSLNGIVSPGQ